ncbi:MAG: restriction endonuclease subunit S [Fimbriimonadaceae bacterium]|nr:restriction endonuclease subunit S [Fimbriimonadaceae bacterium]
MLRFGSEVPRVLNPEESWRRLTLREAGVTLLDCVHKTPPAVDVGLPYIAIPQMKSGRIDPTDARRISESDFREWTRKAKPQPYDVLLSRRCNPGETAHVPPGLDFAVGQNLVLLRADGVSVYPPFLRWLTRSPDWWYCIEKHLNVGAVFDSLRCADVPNFALPIPPFSVQQRVADLLGALDDKIELNRRMNQTVEAMARALFKSWFVDFEPVVAKSEGRPTGLPPDVDALFPSEFEEDEYGELPVGWRRSEVGTHCDVNSTVLGARDSLDRLEYIEISAVSEGDIQETTWYDRANAPGRARRRLKHGDTVLSAVRPDRRAFFLAHEPHEALIASTGFAVLRPLTLPWSYVHAAMTTPEVSY